MLLGMSLRRLLATPPRLAMLISFGTAICGGSAIAAMAPVLEAEPEETGMALATVFTLNALGLVLFPPLGHLLGMTEPQFGIWAALAIHDTSSVVGATAAFGATALRHWNHRQAGPGPLDSPVCLWHCADPSLRRTSTRSPTLSLAS